MLGLGQNTPRELQPVDDKAQAGIDAATAIIAFLIDESDNPVETKKKLSSFLSKYGSSRSLGHFGIRMANILK
ncbi:hypothetical protein FEV32_03375 [Salmonella enterica subsp. enterica]|uniref:hypothetical protein n=1 Tax=Citrobacter freundii TaxID=546 RepID=UPI00182B7F0C|nr:hypothetical protein [Citrobacter freundii]EAU1439420.1 hypothetical protein [Salmonella enterica]EAW3939451.1 hypothetical protein [Salmonella enterica subsp. enterica]EAW4187431.1 hypothetical protein [Salmonella enterica subsp. enterica]EAW4265873.1 hypothetical protein [Salmonella enterica subsp. enterica]EAW4270530.1 hypothetical protein [Salmonella enterica subsp. enterica]